VLAFAPQLESLHRLVTLGRLGVATLALGIALLLAHRWLPATRPTLIEIAPGVALTFITSIGFGEIFGIYLSEYARNYVVTYAGLASVMIALVFLYMIASIFIFGGELNAAILVAKRKRDGNLKVERAMHGIW